MERKVDWMQRIEVPDWPEEVSYESITFSCIYGLWCHSPPLIICLSRCRGGGLDNHTAIPTTRGHKYEPPPPPRISPEQITSDDKEDISINIGGMLGPSRSGTGRGRNGNAGDGLQAKKQTVQREKRGEERRESWKRMTERMKEGRDETES